MSACTECPRSGECQQGRQCHLDAMQHPLPHPSPKKLHVIYSNMPEAIKMYDWDDRSYTMDLCLILTFFAVVALFGLLIAVCWIDLWPFLAHTGM